MKGKRDNYKWLTGYKVVKVIYPDSEHWLGKAVPVVDEGSFFRIDGTYIFDKVDIVGIEEGDGRVTIRMKKMDVVLVGEN